MARLVTIIRIAPIPAPTETRPDGPLARDLAAWVDDPRLPGLERGPLSIMVPGYYTTELDDPADASIVDEVLATFVGRKVLLVDLEGTRAGALLLPGVILPAGT